MPREHQRHLRPRDKAETSQPAAFAAKGAPFWLVLLRRRHIRRRKIRMILQILLPRFIAKHDPESPVRIHEDRFLYVQFVVRNRVLRRLRWIVLDQTEM